MNQNRPQDTNQNFHEAWEQFQKRVKADPQFATWEIALCVWAFAWVTLCPVLFGLGYMIGLEGDAGFGFWLLMATLTAFHLAFVWAGFAQLPKMIEALTGRPWRESAS